MRNDWIDAQISPPQPWQIILFCVSCIGSNGQLEMYTCCGYTYDGSSYTEFTPWGLKTHPKEAVACWSGLPTPPEIADI